MIINHITYKFIILNNTMHGSRHFATLRLQAYLDLVKKWGWKSFTIIYESNEGLVRLQELLKARNGAFSAYPITIRQLGSSRDHR